MENIFSGSIFFCEGCISRREFLTQKSKKPLKRNVFFLFIREPLQTQLEVFDLGVDVYWNKISRVIFLALHVNRETF